VANLDINAVLQEADLDSLLLTIIPSFLIYPIKIVAGLEFLFIIWKHIINSNKL